MQRRSNNYSRIIYNYKIVCILFLTMGTINSFSSDITNIELTRDIIKLDIENKRFSEIYEEQLNLKQEEIYSKIYYHHIYLIDEQIGVLEKNNYNQWASKFKVYYGFDIGNSIESSYIIAITDYGKYYKLHGFETHNFNILLTDNLLPVDKSNILDIVKLYLFTVKFDYFSTRLIIEDDKILEKIKSEISLSVPKIIEKNNKYDVEIYTYDSTTYRIVKYYFEFANNELQLLKEEIVSKGREILIR